MRFGNPTILLTLTLVLSFVSFFTYSSSKSLIAADSKQSLEMAKLHGWVMFNKLDVDQYYSAKELNAFLAGIEMAVKNKVPANAKELYPKLDGFIHSKVSEMVLKEKQENRVLFEKNQNLAQDFIVGLKQREANLRESKTGIFYSILNKGFGELPKQYSDIEIKITERLISGEKTSVYNGNKTITVSVGSQRAGLNQSLALLHEGEKGIFYVPANLAYGLNWKGSIPPGSMIIYEIELIKILDAK